MIEEKVSKGIFFLKTLERLIHGRDHDLWQVRLNDTYHPATIIVQEDRVGIQVNTIRNSEPITCVPVLMCGNEDMLYHPELTLPEHIVEFTWWVSLQPQPVTE